MQGAAARQSCARMVSRGLPPDEAREAVTGLRDAPPPLCGSWARRHPEWHPGEFGAEVVSFLTRGGEGDAETLLIDPLLGGDDDPAWELIEAQAGERIRVLITITYHVRSAEPVRGSTRPSSRSSGSSRSCSPSCS